MSTPRMPSPTQGINLATGVGAAASGINPLLGLLLGSGMDFISGLFEPDQPQPQQRQSFAGTRADPVENAGRLYDIIYSLLPSLIERSNQDPYITARAPDVPGSRLRDPGYQARPRPPAGNYDSTALGLPTYNTIPSITGLMTNPPSAEMTKRPTPPGYRRRSPSGGF